MSLSLELRSNIIVFRIKDINHRFMIDMLSQTEDSVSSPDGMTAVTVFDTEEIAKKAFASMQVTIESFNSEGE